LALALWLIAAVPAQADESFLPPEQAFVLKVDQSHGSGKLGLHWAIAPGYYLYRDRLEVRAAAG